MCVFERKEMSRYVIIAVISILSLITLFTLLLLPSTSSSTRTSKPLENLVVIENVTTQQPEETKIVTTTTSTPATTTTDRKQHKSNGFRSTLLMLLREQRKRLRQVLRKHESRLSVSTQVFQDRDNSCSGFIHLPIAEKYFSSSQKHDNNNNNKIKLCQEESKLSNQELINLLNGPNVYDCSISILVSEAGKTIYKSCSEFLFSLECEENSITAFYIIPFEVCDVAENLFPTVPSFEVQFHLRNLIQDFQGVNDASETISQFLKTDLKVRPLKIETKTLRTKIATASSFWMFDSVPSKHQQQLSNILPDIHFAPWSNMDLTLVMTSSRK